MMMMAFKSTGEFELVSSIGYVPFTLHFVFIIAELGSGMESR